MRYPVVLIYIYCSGMSLCPANSATLNVAAVSYKLTAFGSAKNYIFALSLCLLKHNNKGQRRRALSRRTDPPLG